MSLKGPLHTVRNTKGPGGVLRPGEVVVTNVSAGVERLLPTIRVGDQVLSIGGERLDTGAGQPDTNAALRSAMAAVALSGPSSVEWRLRAAG